MTMGGEQSLVIGHQELKKALWRGMSRESQEKILSSAPMDPIVVGSMHSAEGGVKEDKE